MAREPNLLIEASAGTGKTYALVGRMIDQLRAGVEPRELVSLTFSRAAAGEIFSRFVGTLAACAEKDPEDAKLLRKVIETQHLSMIGTLDSFLMRLVKTFPLEVGLGPETEILDDYEAKSAAAAVSFGILRRTDRGTKRSFTDAFRLAMNHEDARGYIETYRELIRKWHETLLAYPAAEAWGDPETIWREGAPFAAADEDDLHAAAATLRGMTESSPALAGENRLKAAWLKLADWVDGFRGALSGAASLFEKIVAGGDLFARSTVTFRYYREYSFGGGDAAKIKDAVRTVFGYVLRLKLETAKGLYALLAPFEREYERKVRSCGRITFGDLPRLIARLGETDRLAIEFRMDARIRAWALDEFQDTSREQWKAIGNLVHEALASGGDKETFIVGDRKQAIYGWRNGDVRIFTAEKDGGQYAVRPLDESWRYGPEICEAVNRVFRSARIKAECPGWECAEHRTAKPDLHGYVKVAEAPGRRKEDFVEPVAAELSVTRPWERGLDAAILVRSNTMGEFLANELKARGIVQVAWEGESAILDTPALRAFTDLVKLAEHPGDVYAWTHFRLSPLAKAWYGGTLPEAETVAAEFARHFTRKGLVRTFQALRGKLPADPERAWSAFTEARFTDMLRAAAEFELELEAGSRLSDFEAYLEARTKRDFAKPGMVKIMTIHRSKGLTFDYVILPLYEPDGLGGDESRPLLGDGPAWVLPHPGRAIAGNDATLKAVADVRREMDVQEALCIYYVAMTRARQAVSMFLTPAPKGESSATRFSDIVRESGLGEGVGDPDIRIVRGGGEEEGGKAEGVPLPPERGARERIRRRIPSKSFHSGMRAGELFRPAGAREAAKARGTARHADFEKVEFLGAATNDFERAFLKPAGFVELWRERAFEILVDGQWTSGQFDRVVFTDEGDGRRAVIYDFKTNAKRTEESAEAFAWRMTETYAGQMSAYRKALVELTGIEAERVSTVLLLTETAAAVDI